jgi:hypothetical protein
MVRPREFKRDNQRQKSRAIAGQRRDPRVPRAAAVGVSPSPRVILVTDECLLAHETMRNGTAVGVLGAEEDWVDRMDGCLSHLRLGASLIDLQG